MSKIFFPSCKISEAFPLSNAQLAAYLEKRWGIPKAGCCRLGRKELTAKDTAIVICHTCAGILAESSAADVEYAWTYIDKDADFAFPDYGGEKITLQDCFMCKDYPEVMETVRSLLKKMHFEVVELPAHQETADFCGLLTNPILAANAELAPKRFGQKEFHALSAEERKAYLQQHVASITTPRVVDYCRACHAALKQGGANAVHLVELLFPVK